MVAHYLKGTLMDVYKHKLEVFLDLAQSLNYTETAEH